jgi:hypothetical protein
MNHLIKNTNKDEKKINLRVPPNEVWNVGTGGHYKYSTTKFEGENWRNINFK